MKKSFERSESLDDTERGGCLEDPLGLQNRGEVFNTNLERIRRADAVFAYIDREEAYGSAVEIGYAKAIGKPIFVGFSPDAPWQDDMWFAARAGVGWATGHVGSVKFLWEKFYRTIGFRLMAEKLD
jgi:nucleoside 2-deoxyribosyltransferase